MADSPERILLIRPSALGDVCRSVPVLVSLKRAFPGAAIDWLVQDTFAAAVAFHPDLSGVVPFPRARFAAWRTPQVLAEVLRYMRDLGRARYDLVLDCQGLARSGALAWATRAPRRVGYDSAQELGWLGLTQRVPAPRTMHTVDRMLAVARAVGAEPVRDMRLYADPAARRDVLGRFGLRGARYAVLAPTSRWPGKLWPVDRYARLAQGLLDGRGASVDRVLFVGSGGERPQCEPLVRLAERDGGTGRVSDCVGRTSVAELMALIEGAALVVANDSAALHIAVGFDRPWVGLYGPTRVDRVGPCGSGGVVLQHAGPGERLDHKDAAGGRALMERIRADEALEAAWRVLAERAAAPEPAGVLGPPRTSLPAV